MIDINNMEETLTEYDIVVITDCLHGSLRIVDRGNIWKFDEKQRRAVLEKLYDIMHSTPSPIQKT